MNTKTLLRFLLWLSSLVFLCIPCAPLLFAPAPGTTLEKRFTSSAEFELVEMELTIDGLDLMQILFQGFQLRSEQTQDVLVSDRHILTWGGQPRALDRSFESLAQTLEISMSSDRFPDPATDWNQALTSSDLEYSTVEFRWDGEQFEKTFQSGGRRRDDRLLEGLTEDMDLRMLLPDEDVEVGDSWEFDLAALPDLISPGCYFSWGTDTDNTIDWFASTLNPALVGELRAELGGLLRGEASVLYASEDEDLCVLEFAVDAQACSQAEDLERLAERIVGSADSPSSILIESLHLDLDVHATGTANWDSARGHVRDAQLSGGLESCLEMTLLVEGWGREYEVILRTVVRGDFELRVTVE